jgi:cytochrome c peroxidase
MSGLNKILWVTAVITLQTFIACKVDDELKPPVDVQPPISSTPTPYNINYPGGLLWPRLKIPADNPLTVEGIALGKKLFYDNILSADNSISCASCHAQNLSFSDSKKLSVGINGQLGLRNAMPLFNLGWFEDPLLVKGGHGFFWDGRVATLENQAIAPIEDPREMNQNLAELEQELRAHAEYPALFKRAFGTDSITTRLVMFAIAQFERTLISGNSKFDQFKRGEIQLTESELRGLTLFTTERADCFHCHGNDRSPFFTDFKFHNNGLDSVPTDLGLGGITGKAEDRGLFKTPSLRNLSFTAPYMHDGRFNTLEEVIEFYNSGTKNGATTDLNIIKNHPKGGLNLSPQDKQDLIAFLKTLDDYSFITDLRFSK